MIAALLLFLPLVLPAPVVVSEPPPPKKQESRKEKSLNYFDYFQPEELGYNEFDNEADYSSLDVEDNELSRAIPTRKKYPRPFNSPIYYIRLPPQPYMFVPGFGYVSQPAPHPMNQFLNVPVSFISNGKPSNIYQWSGALEQFPGMVPPNGVVAAPSVAPPPPPPPKPRPDSAIHRLPGQYTFNGKPDDIYVLRDSYNSLYSDALQNFYP